MKKENIEKVLQDAWLGINVKDDDLFNPIDFIFHDGDTDKILERIALIFPRNGRICDVVIVHRNGFGF